MESTGAPSHDQRPQHGYSRSDVDAFVVAAAAERERLEVAHAAEQARARQARVSLGTHRVMVAMLLDAHREIDEIRGRAEVKAAELLAAGVDDAPGTHDALLIDLTVRPGTAGTPRCDDGLHPAATNGSALGTSDYYEFLRGALADDEPLGPRPNWDGMQ
jgi:hypothetical protein